MEFVLHPFPHLHFSGDAAREVLANCVVFGLVGGLVAALGWIGVLFWLERER